MAPAAPARAHAAEGEGGRELRAITEAERTLVYSGYKTAVHGAEGGGRRTRMRVSRLADGRMIMEWERDGATTRRWVVRHRHRWIDDPSLLLDNYDVVVAEEGGQTVAWREVRRVELRPRRAGRPSLTLLVDAETRLVLAERLRDHDGVERFSWQFDTLAYTPLELDVDAAEVVTAPRSRDVDATERARSPVTLGTPPDGFRCVGRGSDDDGALVEYWSDGLAAFSLRQRPAGATGGAGEGELERRSCSGRSSVSVNVAGTEVTILGNIPTDELEAVAAGLRVRP